MDITELNSFQKTWCNRITKEIPLDFEVTALACTLEKNINKSHSAIKSPLVDWGNMGLRATALYSGARMSSKKRVHRRRNTVIKMTKKAQNTKKRMATVITLMLKQAKVHTIW